MLIHLLVFLMGLCDAFELIRSETGDTFYTIVIIESYPTSIRVIDFGIAGLFYVDGHEN